MTLIPAHRGTFQKTNGEFRTMAFVEFSDLPESFGLKPSTKRYAPGVREVWEIGVGVKNFNDSTVSGEIKHFSIKESSLRS